MSPATRGLIAPAVAATVVTAVLLSLGTWQVGRLAWKTELIATMAERVKFPPITAPTVAEARGADPEALDFRPVTLAGTYLAAGEVHVHAILGEARGRFSGPGVWVMTPLSRDDGSIVWINRGFAPRRGAEVAPYAPPPEGPVTIDGLLRRPEPRGSYAPADDPAHRLWFVRDPSVLAAAVGLEAGKVAPYTIDAGAATTPPGGLPQAGETRMSYPNDHLGYAITWYGLALTCVGVFAVFARGRMRRATRAEPQPSGTAGRPY